jgi:hypothetical protein
MMSAATALVKPARPTMTTSRFATLTSRKVPPDFVDRGTLPDGFCVHPLDDRANARSTEG